MKMRGKATFTPDGGEPIDLGEVIIVHLPEIMAFQPDRLAEIFERRLAEGFAAGRALGLTYHKEIVRIECPQDECSGVHVFVLSGARQNEDAIQMIKFECNNCDQKAALQIPLSARVLDYTFESTLPPETR